MDSVTSGDRVPAEHNCLGAALHPEEASEGCHQPSGRSVLLKEIVASYLPTQGGQEQMLYWKQGTVEISSPRCHFTCNTGDGLSISSSQPHEKQPKTSRSPSNHT